jgi:hypothetical protein
MVYTTPFHEKNGFKNIPVQISMIKLFKNGMPLEKVTTLRWNDQYKNRRQLECLHLNQEEDDE